MTTADLRLAGRSAPVTSLSVRRRRFAFVLMTPWLIGAVLFFALPLVAVVFFSLTHYDLLSPPVWVGLANYQYLLGGDPQIVQAIGNTLWILLIMVPCQVLFAFAVGFLLSRIRTGTGIFRTIFYLPSLLPMVAATVGFIYVLNPGGGPVNQVLGALHLPTPGWFTEPGWSKPSLTVLAVWGAGNLMVIFLAAMLQVPKELYEAAELDGAGGWRRLIHITVPTLRPVTLFAVVTTVIAGLQYFDQAYVVAALSATTGKLDSAVLGYPQGSTMFYPLWLYQQGFKYFNMGYASAMSVVLLIVAMAVASVLLLRSSSLIRTSSGVDA